MFFYLVTVLPLSILLAKSGYVILTTEVGLDKIFWWIFIYLAIVANMLMIHYFIKSGFNLW